MPGPLKTGWCGATASQSLVNLEAALAGKRLGLLDLIVRTPEAPAPIAVPKALADFVIEAGKAADYDHLLLTDGGSHE